LIVALIDFCIIAVIFLGLCCHLETRSSVSALVQFAAGRIPLPSVFLFEVTQNDARLPLAYAGLYSLLTHMRPARFQYSANIFIYNATLPDNDCEDIRFLRSIHREIDVRFHAISMEDAIERTGVKFPWEAPLHPGQFKGRNMFP
jgi:hypothetical protein